MPPNDAPAPAAARAIVRARRINSWHAHLARIAPVLPSDYASYGGTVERWKDEDSESYPDCSGGCYWARWLGEGLGGDWCVCSRPDAPRVGMLTFEHQAGKLRDCVTPCFESPEDYRRRVRAGRDAAKGAGDGADR